MIYEGQPVVTCGIKKVRNLPPNDIVLYTDCWDVFFCCRLDEVVDKFEKLSKPIIYSAEANFFSVETERGFISGISENYPPSPTRWRYANGGQIIGRADALLEMWSHPGFWPSEVKSIQGAYHHWILTHPHEFALDNYCQIFLPLHCDWNNPNVYIPDLLEVRQTKNGPRVYNKETNTYPCTIHGNGGDYRKIGATFWHKMKEMMI